MSASVSKDILWERVYKLRDLSMTPQPTTGTTPSFNIDWIDYPTRIAAVSALVGGLVIAIALIVARPSLIMVEPDGIYETPHINVFSVAVIFIVVSGTLFMVDANQKLTPSFISSK